MDNLFQLHFIRQLRNRMFVPAAINECIQEDAQHYDRKEFLHFCWVAYYEPRVALKDAGISQYDTSISATNKVKSLYSMLQELQYSSCKQL